VSDADENPFEIGGAEAEIAFETLMGWDGELCQCECGCRELRDTLDDPRCALCREGRHSSGDGGRIERRASHGK
jgi:hypothetical protein